MRSGLFLASTAIFCYSTVANAQVGYCGSDNKPQDPMCLSVLETKGWKRLAQCTDGYFSSQIVEKNSKRMICQDYSGRAGIVNEPCEAFVGDFDEYKKEASKYDPSVKRIQTNINCYAPFVSSKKVNLQ